MEDKKIQVLHFNNNLYNGGIESFCLNINKNIDSNKFKFDYFLVTENENQLKEEFECLGANVIEIKDIRLGVVYKFLPRSVRLFFAVLKYLRQNPVYSAIHIQNCIGVISILLAAFISRIPIRIIHSHNSYSPHWNEKLFSFKVRFYLYWRKLFIHLLATHKLGCSLKACRAMYGDSCVNDKLVKVIFNGINLQVFKPENYNRIDSQKKYGINSYDINFIFVGRFEPQKNPLFLIEVMSEICRVRDKVHLTIVGQGDLEADIKVLINKFNLRDKITLLPHNSNVPELLSAMDYFLLPSIYEGLGIVLIEAQAMGLPCFASSCVPDEAQLGLCSFISLEKGAKGWASYIESYIKKNIKLSVDCEKLTQYDIKSVAKCLENIYQ